MTTLESLVPGCVARLPNEPDPVTIIDFKPHGDTSVVLTFQRADGSLDQAVLIREDEPFISLVESHSFSFDADSEEMKLVSEAYRIKLAPLFDPYLATRSSAIQPLPHQISAVYQEMLPRVPLRYVLADDPGAGKTVMAGLLIKEMMGRGALKRCLVVCPGSLAEQWQDELLEKFDLRFTILTNDVLEAAATRNAFLENDLCIARLDKLARDEDARAKLDLSRWDLVVVDEAHKMSATVTGGEVKRTKRYQLGQQLGRLTENLLLMTATPHNGKPRDFQLFMALVDPDRFEGAAHGSAETPDVSDLMRRLVKEDLLTFDGTPLFPERRAYTVNYELSPAEAALYDAVTEYVREGFNRADKLDGKRKNSVGFALTMLQRRLASSPEAIYQSLRRRRERLERRLEDLKAGRDPDRQAPAAPHIDFEDYDEDDYTEEELEDAGQVLDTATAAATQAELEAEIAELRSLEQQAGRLRASGEDSKWRELSRLLQDDKRVFDEDGQREKLIIFTEHKDTLNYLASKIRRLLGDHDAVITIQGGMSRDARREAEERFKQDKRVRILVATDAAGEGINLQRAHLMINYDLPWNPNRLEQRFGRIHRIGQTEVCHLWNLVSTQTREGQVFERLLGKLDEESRALGGRVFNVLGSLSFDDKPLSELLLEAVRYGEDPEVRDRINQVVDGACSKEELQRLLDENALTRDVMNESSVRSIREDMERAAARKLEPHFIEDFCVEALESLGGSIIRREPGRYEVLAVPMRLRSYADAQGLGKLQFSYERVCFARDDCERAGLPVADLVCPGHPLLDSLCGYLYEENKSLLAQGCIYIDEDDRTERPRLLFYLQDELTDGSRCADGTPRIVARSVDFVEIPEQGEAYRAGYAPYLDYAAPSDEERAALLDYAQENDLLGDNAQAKAESYANEHIIPAMREAESERRRVQADKAEAQVRQRLTEEVRYWEARELELKDAERKGKTPKMNSMYARQKAEEMESRMNERLAQIERERRVTARPCRVVGGALVAPRSFVEQLMGRSCDRVDVQARRRVELAAMDAVMRIARSLGNEPRDVSKENCGYDVESRVGEGPAASAEGNVLRLIEVKGRIAGSPTVTVSRNEVLCAMNNPDTFILAAVEVDDDCTRTVYFKRPFAEALGRAQTSGNFNLQELKCNCEVLLERELPCR